MQLVNSGVAFVIFIALKSLAVLIICPGLMVVLVLPGQC
jgi:hypothetical protein